MTFTDKFDRLYPVALAYNRVFVTGPLKGIVMRDTTRFVNRQRAAQWVRGIRRNSRLGLLDYKLLSIEVVR